MGPFWQLIQDHLDRMEFPPSNRRLADRLDIAPTTLTNWRRGLKALPDQENLEAVAAFIGKPYDAVLGAALDETGYSAAARKRQSPKPPSSD